MEISDAFMILRSSQCIYRIFHRKFKLSFYHKLESLKFLNPRFFREQNAESPTRSFALLITYIREHIAKCSEALFRQVNSFACLSTRIISCSSRASVFLVFLLFSPLLARVLTGDTRTSNLHVKSRLYRVLPNNPLICPSQSGIGLY